MTQGAKSMGSDEQHGVEAVPESIIGKPDQIPEGQTALKQMIWEHRTETRQGKQEFQTLINTFTAPARIDRR
jgi:hypothetical protein